MSKKFDALRLGIENHVESPECTLTSNPIVVTNIDWLKNDHRSRQSIQSNLSVAIPWIRGDFPSPRVATFFAIPGHNLPHFAEWRLRLYAEPEHLTDGTGHVYTSDWQSVGSIKPLGLWQAGIDPYGTTDHGGFRSVISHWFPAPVVFKMFQLQIRHNYDFVAPGDPPPVTQSNGIWRQDTNGVFCANAESPNSIATAAGSDSWAIISSTFASGGLVRYKSGEPFYWSHTEGPRVEYPFHASQSGLHDVWMRLHSTEGNSLFTVFDGERRTHVFNGTTLVDQGWQWLLVRQVNLTAETLHSFVVAARDKHIRFDKLVIQPANAAAPTDLGPPESGEGTETVYASGITITAQDNIALRNLQVGRHISLKRNFSYGALGQFITDPDIVRNDAGFAETARDSRLARSFQCELEGFSDNDRMLLWNFEQERRGRSFIINPYPEKNRPSWLTESHIMLAKFESALPFRHLAENAWSTTLQLIEV